MLGIHSVDLLLSTHIIGIVGYDRVLLCVGSICVLMQTVLFMASAFIVGLFVAGFYEKRFGVG